MPESFKEDGRPADQWYWDDWFSAFDVRLCSLAARGLWIDMIGIMFKSEIRGTLTINGKQVDGKRLAKIVGETIANTNKLLNELEEQDVFSRLKDGTIICRRMFRKSGKKDQISHIRSEAGKRGAEVRWQKKAKMAASSSTSSSISIPSSNTYRQSESEKSFEKWWKRYPRAEDKGKAKSLYLNLIENEGVEPQVLDDALTGYINVLNNNETPKQYVKHAKTFLYNGNKAKKIPSTWEQFVKFADPKYKAKPSL